MSRSLGHRPYKKTDSYAHPETFYGLHRPWHRKNGAVDWHTLYDLRYPKADVKKAAEEGRKPRAEKVRRKKIIYTYGRGSNRSLTAIQVYTKELQSGARSYERDALVKAVKTVNTRRRRFEFDATLDIVPYRTRHTALWNAT